ncbi:MAG: peptidoglycan editing factor PgeF [Litorimonas sp.]
MSVPFKTHDLLNLDGVSHGFFGRTGGASTRTPYHSLNAAHGSRDDPQAVTQNRALIAGALGTAPECLMGLSQIHSADVLIIDAPFKDPISGDIPQADGLVTKTAGLAISVLSADCGPVLLCDPNAKVIGACHAGWRGAVTGITTQTIKAMCAIGAKRENICAVIGPCISQPNYEVGHDFQRELISQNKDHDVFFTVGPTGKPHFDLKRFILSKLRGEGLTQIDALPDCTYGQADDYFSYRYNTHQNISGYGRNLSAIMLT